MLVADWSWRARMPCSDWLRATKGASSGNKESALVIAVLAGRGEGGAIGDSSQIPAMSEMTRAHAQWDALGRPRGAGRGGDNRPKFKGRLGSIFRLSELQVAPGERLLAGLREWDYGGAWRGPGIAGIADPQQMKP